MKRAKRLPIPQHEFGFAPAAFNLVIETALDGERIARERTEADRARQLAEAAQTPLFAPKKATPQPSPYRLRAGDLVEYAGKPCPVMRVNDCAAVIALTKPPREFTTVFGVRVRIQPKPALIRISPQSEIPILNR